MTDTDERDGPVVKGRPHPLLGAERRAWASYYDGIRRLKLER
jgi:hypothetical protein